MKDLLASIMTKITGSAFATDVGSRVYYGQAPPGTTLPYAVFSIVTGTPEDTFTERVTDTMIQFSLYSSSLGLTEVGTMYTDLRSLFDDATFTVASNTLLRCMWQNMTTVTEDGTTLEGNVGLKHWAVEYLMTTEAT